MNLDQISVSNVGLWSGREKKKREIGMARKRAENREGSLGFPGFVKPVFTKDSKPLGRRKRSLGHLGSVKPVEETFDKLRELFIADQIKKSAPYEFQEHFLDEWSTISSPAEIAEKFEEYESVRRTLRPKFYNSFAKGRYEASGSSDTYFQRTEYLHGGSNRLEKKTFSIERYLLLREK
ncbi:peptidase A2 domain-containing protein [Trichonephila clavipes]|nr:peptidase A2 domain-containing protein [Trichonephila clavipes]